MSVIEAMLCGLPVVATNIRGPREQVIDGVTGYLVPPASVEPLAAALQQLASDQSLRARLAAAGLIRGKHHFQESVVIARTLDALAISPARA